MLTFAEIAVDKITADGSYASDKRTYSYGTHAAHVAVDPRTGHVQVLEYVSVEDVGRIINPATVHAQTVGAIVQGLGGALLEHLRYDDDGQLLTVILCRLSRSHSRRFSQDQIHRPGTPSVA